MYIEKLTLFKIYYLEVSGIHLKKKNNIMIQPFGYRNSD